MAEGETITFELIRRIQREEARLTKLTKLPPAFYESVRSYMQTKRDSGSRRFSLEVKNVERLVEDIFNRRERKIFNLALIAARTSIPPENLTEEEQVFFDQVVYMVKKRRTDLLDMMVEKEQGEQTGLVVFKEDVPEFMGSDMKSYGPFKKGDIAKLPDDNKAVLVSQGIVDEFKISK
jgi:DNA replication initiation complex subunit (GINS family)